MRQLQHTPGPWTLYQGRNHLYEVAVIEDPGCCAAVTQRVFYIAGPDHPSHFVADLVVAAPHHDGEDPEGDGLANAQLIASAPELLEACRMALNFCDRTPNGDQIAVILREAIAKAESPSEPRT